MKTHSQEFKEQIKNMGRELDSKITYTIDNEEIELGNEELNSITPHYEGNILKSVMKQLDIDSNVDIPVGTQINAQFGIKIDDEYEYLNYGNYIVYSSEKQEDTRSYKIVAYDKMLYSMKDYITPMSINLFDKESATSGYYISDTGAIVERTGVFYSDYIKVKPSTTYCVSGRNGGWATTAFYDASKTFISRVNESNNLFTTTSSTYYIRIDGNVDDLNTIMINEGTTTLSYEPYGKIQFPLTIRNYLKYLCREIGLEFANENDTFVNYNKEIASELYLDENGNSLDYTFRDVLDELAQVTASTICINEDDELEIRYINDTDTNKFEIEGNTTQDGTPTPSNPVEIVNKTGEIEEEINGLLRTINIGDIELCKIGTYKDRIFKTSGKNLLPNNATTQTINGVTFTVNGGKSVTLNGTASAIADFYMFGSLTDTGEYLYIPKGTYSISDPSTGWFYIGREKTLGAVVGNMALLNALSSQDCYFYGFIIRATSGSSFSNLTLFPMINEGTTVLPYEPYGTNEWYLEKHIGKYIFTGNEANISLQNNGKRIYIGTKASSIPDALHTPNVNITYGMYCNKLEEKTAGQTWGGTQGISYDYNRGENTGNFDISINGISTLQAYKNAIVGITTYYILQTPTYTLIEDANILKSLNETGLDIIDEEYLKDVNVNFGEKYGPINTISFKRSADSDVITKSIPSDLADDDKIEISISDNQILNGNNRDEFIDGILNKLYGLEYYINDYSSTGICYLDLCDRYNVKVDDKFYSCIMFNDEVDITQGLEERVYTDMPNESKTDYKKASSTDRKVNQAYIIVDKVNQEITAVTSETQSLSTQVTNNYNELLQSIQNLDTSVTQLDTRTTQVEQLQTDTYTKTEIKEIITGTNADGINVTSLKSTSATFDEDGMHYAKTGALTSSTINQSGLEVDDNSGTQLLFAGYDEELLQALVKVANLYLTRYLGFENWRLEEVEDSEYGIGLGFFYTGGE